MADQEAVLYRFPDRRSEVNYDRDMIKVGDRLVRGNVTFEVTAVGSDQFGHLVVMLDRPGSSEGKPS